VFVAESEAEARRLFTSAQQQFTRLLRGRPGKLPPPIDHMDTFWNPLEKAQASAMLACSFVGTPGQVRAGLEDFVEKTNVDELFVVSAIHDHAARLRSCELLANAWRR
jgi:alkanesulfonate monooxygenase SsuD/methylene tetrahydromethanopterin reductase-like flavin-dependent oxidoreductase (luciferase family)